MRTDEDETEEDIYHDACFATEMCCLKLASKGGEINRERLAIELMQLLGAVIEKREETSSIPFTRKEEDMHVNCAF